MLAADYGASQLRQLLFVVGVRRDLSDGDAWEFPWPAITELGAKVIRVDSGGALNGALLEAGLVDESAGDGPRWYGDASPQAFELESTTALDGGLAAAPYLRSRRFGTVSARCVPAGLTVQSGCPGIGGVLVP